MIATEPAAVYESAVRAAEASYDAAYAAARAAHESAVAALEERLAADLAGPLADRNAALAAAHAQYAAEVGLPVAADTGETADVVDGDQSTSKEGSA